MSHPANDLMHMNERAESGYKPFRILLLTFEAEDKESLFIFGDLLAKERSGELVMADFVAVPEDRPLSDGVAEAEEHRRELDAILARHDHKLTRIRPVVCVDREGWDGIWETVAHEEIDLLLMVWNQHLKKLGEILGNELSSPPCDVMIVRPGEHRPERKAWYDIERILLPLRASPHAILALRMATVIARANKAQITHLNVQEKDEDEQALKSYAKSIRHLPSVTRSITAVGEVVDTILEQAVEHDLIVLGAPTRRLSPDRRPSTMLDAVGMTSDRTLVVVKDRALPKDKDATSEAHGMAVNRDRPVAVVVDKWFAENTFHSREFNDLEHLMALKKQQNLTISLGLPALNEEKTVGNVIRTIKEALQDAVPLLDEIVLIDSGSGDYTREIAQDLGIPVHIHQKILPAHGAYAGKGEALWKSLYVLNGDLIVWIDTDIVNIHPRFVYGVIGPLLKDPRIQYTKGFYRRPLKAGDKMVAGGGGRVTELTARPLLNLFFPELSGIVQPLSGEYAGRRKALEKVPFFTGYGVETGLLIDLFSKFGLSAIAQSDLLERIHHNQPLPSLSKMAFTIIQVVISRLENRHDVRLLDEIDKTMKLIRYQPGRYNLETTKLTDKMRPPMIEIPEYKKKFGKQV